MPTKLLGDPAYRRTMGDGLVLRWSTAADLEALQQMYAYVFRDSAEAPPNPYMPAWVGDMVGGRHPLIGAGDFALVEDTRRGAVVAATCLLAQTWEYEGIAFPV